MQLSVDFRWPGPGQPPSRLASPPAPLALPQLLRPARRASLLQPLLVPAHHASSSLFLVISLLSTILFLSPVLSTLPHYCRRCPILQPPLKGLTTTEDGGGGGWCGTSPSQPPRRPLWLRSRSLRISAAMALFPTAVKIERRNPPRSKRRFKRCGSRFSKEDVRVPSGTSPSALGPPALPQLPDVRLRTRDVATPKRHRQHHCAMASPWSRGSPLRQLVPSWATPSGASRFRATSI